MSQAGRLIAVAAICGAFFSSSLRAENPLQGVIESQLNSARDANNRNRNASNAARNAGRDAIGRGGRNMSNGHHHHHMPQVNLGAFQIAQGLLGLLAAAQADKLANQDSTIAGNLDALPGSGPDDSSANSAGTGAGEANNVSGTSRTAAELTNSSAAAVKIGQSDLANPDVKQALSQIQEQFGYSPAQFVEKLAAGRDPSSLLTHAPKNALTAEEALAAARAASAAPSPPTAGDSSGSSLALGAASSAATEETAASPARSGNALRDALARRLAADGGDDSEDVEVSPEVKAALAARAEEAERARKASAAMRTEEYDLFQVVHLKYVERAKSLGAYFK